MKNQIRFIGKIVKMFSVTLKVNFEILMCEVVLY